MIMDMDYESDMLYANSPFRDCGNLGDASEIRHADLTRGCMHAFAPKDVDQALENIQGARTGQRPVRSDTYELVGQDGKTRVY